jgi:cytochrome bd-type quinol oxidase subunit 2
MSRKTYWLFAVPFLVFGVVIFVVRRVVFDRHLPLWLLIPVVIVIVVGLVLDTRYQRARAKQEGRL